jgi:uncharacterized protein DUF1579
MKIRSTVAVLSLLALPLALAVPLAAQDPEKPKEPAAPPAMSAAEMEAMQKAMSPGEPHKRLARLAGDWTFTTTMHMAPGQPPVESEGTMHGEVLLGGRYVEHTWKGNMMGMAFEGRGTDAYDNVAKQYVSSWIDSMSTGIVVQTGACDDAGKTCTYTGDVWDPMTGQKSTMKSVITWIDDNTFTNAMYGKGPTGEEMKMMEIVAKRK